MMAHRTWDSDGTAHWVSSDLLLSYALIKDRPIIKDLSVVAGVRWDYQTMSFDDPRNALGVLSSPADTVDFRMQTLAPVAGLSLTVGGLKSGIWLGDVHLRVLAGPIVWGNEDYRETFGGVIYIRFKGDLSHGYVVRGYGDFTLLSGKITPTMEGSLAFFAQLTRTSAAGEVDGSFERGWGPVRTISGVTTSRSSSASARRWRSTFASRRRFSRHPLPPSSPSSNR